MRVCGIVAEYNPFHNGHAHHIAQTRRALGDAAIVCVMSGSFVQRGEAALLSKHARARMALECGADLILELPSPYALLSAEGFARSAVYILNNLGVVTDLSFGAETADVASLTQVARVLLEHQTVLDTLAHLKEGVSYAAARERALYAAIKEKAAIISSPNNILAVEYIKALISLGSPIAPLAIARKGAAHDSADTSEGFASASALRARLRDGAKPPALADFMPRAALAVLEDESARGRALIDTERLEAMLLSSLLRQTPETLRALPDVSEGLEYRVYAAIRAGGGLDAIAERARTRRYTLARVRRILARAALGLDAGLSGEPPAYARVLGADDRGRQVLRLAAKSASIPLITKPAHVKKLSAHATALFEAEARCVDFSSLALPAWRELPLGSDWLADAHTKKHDFQRENTENP